MCVYYNECVSLIFIDDCELCVYVMLHVSFIFIDDCELRRHKKICCKIGFKGQIGAKWWCGFLDATSLIHLDPPNYDKMG